MSEANDTDRHGPGVRLHPPVIFAISILAGIGLNNLWPFEIWPELQGKLFGACILVLAMVIALWSLYEFYRAGTDVRPDKPDSALITGGPYRYTRNPLYIVLSLIQAAVAFWLNTLWILLPRLLKKTIQRSEYASDTRSSQRPLAFPHTRCTMVTAD